MRTATPPDARSPHPTFPRGEGPEGRRRSKRRRAIQLIGLLLILCLTTIAHARAGGGGGFGGGHGGGGFGGGGHSSGGGFHSSGGGYHSGGGQDSPAFVILIILIIVVVIVIATYQTARDAKAAQNAQIVRHRVSAAAAERIAAELRERDPAFDAAAFYGRVAAAFVAIQNAWSAQNLTSIQRFISDGVLERFGLQIREQKALGHRDAMSGITVERVLLAQLISGSVFETVTLSIEASAVDYKASLKDGRRISGSLAPQPFTEYWTFIRRRGVQSLAGAGLIEGNCPNCGGDVSINQNAACAHCGALLRSGQYDWVLCEITQASEWRPAANRQIDGFDQLLAVDPGLSTDDLEDRASVIFWRRAEANRTQQPAPLAKVALDDFTKTWTANGGDVRRDGSRFWIGEIGVGSVDTVAVIRGEDFDRALVQIAWQGTHFWQTPNGPVQRGDEASIVRERFTLCRKPGVQSTPDKGITSAHCPSCGAPTADTLSNACDSCGTVLNDGSTGWVLESVEPANQPIVLPSNATVDSKIPPPPLPSAREALLWAVHMAAADGQITTSELKQLERFAARARITPAEVNALVAAARAGRLDAPLPQNREQGQAWLVAMVDVALADGQISSQEVELLRTTADKIGMSDADIRMLIKREQARLNAEARAASRERNK